MKRIRSRERTAAIEPSLPRQPPPPLRTGRSTPRRDTKNGEDRATRRTGEQPSSPQTDQNRASW